MVDQISIDRIALLHPSLQSEAMEIYSEICKTLKGHAICRIAYTLRTYAEQDALYAKGRTVAGKIVTNAKAGYSFHCFGMAIDIVLLKDTNGDGTFDTASWETNKDFDGDGQFDWMEIVNIFKLRGWQWGGKFLSFKDMPHFQKTFKHTTEWCRNAPKIPGTNYPIL